MKPASEVLSRLLTPMSVAGLLGVAAFVVCAARAQVPSANQRPYLDRQSLLPASSIPGGIPAEVRKAIEAEKYDRAAERLDRELSANPGELRLLLLYGRILFLDGQLERSIDAIERVRSLAALNSADRFTLAMAYASSGDLTSARSELEALAQRHPSNPLFQYWLGRVEFRAQHFERALGHFKRSLSLDPRFLRAADQVGLCHQALGNYDAALSALKGAVDLNRTLKTPSPWPPYNLGDLLALMERNEQAVPYLKEAISFEPGFALAHYRLGMVLQDLGRNAQAVLALKKALDLNPEDSRAYYALGRLYQRSGRQDDARRMLEGFARVESGLRNPDHKDKR